MSKKAVGILVGLAAGLGGALWLLRKKGLIGGVVKEVNVVLKKLPTNNCGFASVEPDVVELSRSRGDRVKWLIENHDCQTVEVCVAAWKFGGEDTDPPVEFENGEKCKTVQQGHTKQIKAKAKFVTLGDYKYSLKITGGQELDPIVRIVL